MCKLCTRPRGIAVLARLRHLSAPVPPRRILHARAASTAGPPHPNLQRECTFVALEGRGGPEASHRAYLAGRLSLRRPSGRGCPRSGRRKVSQDESRSWAAREVRHLAALAVSAVRAVVGCKMWLGAPAAPPHSCLSVLARTRSGCSSSHVATKQRGRPAPGGTGPGLLELAGRRCAPSWVQSPPVQALGRRRQAVGALHHPAQPQQIAAWRARQHPAQPWPPATVPSMRRAGRGGGAPPAKAVEPAAAAARPPCRPPHRDVLACLPGLCPQLHALCMTTMRLRHPSPPFPVLQRK